MRKLLFLFILLSQLDNEYASAQSQLPQCGYKQVMQQYEKAYPGFKKFQDVYFEDVNRNSNLAHKTSGTIYRIPVVFHVIYNNAIQNIDDSNIHSQLAVLNSAFRNNHADTGNTRPIFKPLAADAEIEFYLATQDPDGNPTTGITRTFSNVSKFGDFTSLFSGVFDSFERVKHTALGGIDSWPADRYLNIWIADIADPLYGIALLGYATPPTNPLPPNWGNYVLPPIGDGVVLLYQTIGKNNPYTGDLMGLVSAGRTAVHEVGHYLGLRHISGDGNDCSDGDDGIYDTPTMMQSTQQNSCDTGQNTCNLTAIDTLDMWENYMDYSNDLCQTMFTQGQVALMRSIASNQRSILEINDLSKVNHSFTIYPNPATHEIYIDYPGKIETYVIYNIMGQAVQKADSKTVINGELKLNGIPPSNYILELTTPNGKLHQRFQVR
jgi:hypothetical protein